MLLFSSMAQAKAQEQQALLECRRYWQQVYWDAKKQGAPRSYWYISSIGRTAAYPPYQTSLHRLMRLPSIPRH